MVEIKQTCYKGTRILLGNGKREMINQMIDILKSEGFQEIQIPIIQSQETFSGKVGDENQKMMFNFKDLGDRDLCLAPEYTAVIQQLAKKTFTNDKDIKVFYVQECFRGEKPQAGRYREFTQLGVEIINPKKPDTALLYATNLAVKLMATVTENSELNTQAKRGLDYYKEGQGFEISCPELGSSKQVCGGGQYEGGVGFAIGIDRLLNLV